MTRSRLGWIGRGGVALLVVVLTAGTALASVAYPNPRRAIPGNYAYNYSNSLDFTGTPGTAGFRLHDAFVTDGTEPAKVLYVKSKDGVNWTAPAKVSGSANTEGSSLATTGSDRGRRLDDRLQLLRRRRRGSPRAGEREH